MNERDINYLLQKYETRQPGEAASTKRLRLEKREQLLKDKKFILDLHNTTIGLTHGQKLRAMHIIERINFKEYTNSNYEQVILTIMISIKKADYPSLKLSTYNDIITENAPKCNTLKKIFLTFVGTMTGEELEDWLNQHGIE